jgi:serine/threonine protein phosphatase PrpC
MARAKFTVRAFTDVGLRRKRNEDALLVSGWLCQTHDGTVVTMEFRPAPPFVCAVADGMGGHAGGDLASRLALTALAAESPAWRSANDVYSTLIGVNDEVRNMGIEKNMPGLGTTIAGLCVVADNLIFFNVGDSRVYSKSPGYLAQMSNDHSIFGPDGRPSNVITQSLGQPYSVTPQIVVRGLTPGVFLMCSDGVSGLMSDEHLSDLMLLDDLDEAAAQIIATTRANGAHDNFSFVIVEVAMLEEDDDARGTSSAETVIAPSVGHRGF